MASVVFVQLRKQVSTWRVRWPAAELTRRGLDVRCYAFGAQPAGPVFNTDTVIWHVTPETSWPHTYAVEFKKGCRRLIVQLDDDWTALRDIQPVTADAMAWQGSLLETLRLADTVVVENPRLAAAYAPYAVGEPVVIRNYPPADLAGVRARGRRGRVAGWMGRPGGVHAADIAPLAAAWPAEISLAFIGGGPEAADLHPRAIWTEPTDNDLDLYTAMAAMTVGLAPLRDHRFNHGKSWNKPLEFLTLGVPVVATDCPPYRDLLPYVAGLRLVDSIEAMVDQALAWLDDPPGGVSVDRGLTLAGTGGEHWMQLLR